MITVTSKKEKYAMEATNGKVNIMADIPNLMVAAVSIWLLLNYCAPALQLA